MRERRRGGGCSGKERRKSSSRKSLKVARNGKERVFGGINPTGERFFSLPTQEQVDQAKLPLAFRILLFFSPFFAHVSSLVKILFFFKALLHLPHGGFGSFLPLTEEKPKPCFLGTRPGRCGVPVPPRRPAHPPRAARSISSQAGDTPKLVSPQTLGSMGKSPSSSLLQRGDGAKPQRPDPGFLPKLGINWVKVSVVRLAKEPRLLPGLGPQEGAVNYRLRGMGRGGKKPACEAPAGLAERRSHPTPLLFRFNWLRFA